VYGLTPYRTPDDWVFASDSRRAGKKRGKQPLWLSTIMRYHIQPPFRLSMWRLTTDTLALRMTTLLCNTLRHFLQM
jgi:hypothetical protein